MSTLVHSIRRRALVVGLVVASLAGASGAAYASAAAQLSDGPAKATRIVDGSLYGFANSYTPTRKSHAVKGVVDGSLYGFANSYTPTPKSHAVVGERTVVRCDVPVGTAHADDLWRCE